VQRGIRKDFSNVNETRIKILSSYPIGHVDVRFSVDKKKYISGKKRCFDAAHVCGNSFHALRCPGVFGMEMKIYERSLEAILSLPHPPRFASSLACLIFTISPKWRAFSQANTELTNQIE